MKICAPASEAAAQIADVMKVCIPNGGCPAVKGGCSGTAAVFELAMWLGSTLIRRIMRCCMPASEEATM
jgi:hypothetical protein